MTSKLNMAPFGALLMGCGFIVMMMIAVAAAMDGSWVFGKDSIYALVFSEVPMAAMFFKVACYILATVMILVPIAVFVKNKSASYSFVALLTLIAGICLAAAMFVDSATAPGASLCFTGVSILAIFCSIYANYHGGARVSAVMAGLLSTIIIASIFGCNIPAFSAVMMIVILAWIFVQGTVMSFSKA